MRWGSCTASTWQMLAVSIDHRKGTAGFWMLYKVLLSPSDFRPQVNIPIRGRQVGANPLSGAIGSFGKTMHPLSDSSEISAPPFSPCISSSPGSDKVMEDTESPDCISNLEGKALVGRFMSIFKGRACSSKVLRKRLSELDFVYSAYSPGGPHDM
jgi:hypothetical protein